MLRWVCELYNANRPGSPPEILDEILIINDGTAAGAGRVDSLLGNYRVERRRPFSPAVIGQVYDWPRTERDTLELLIAAAPSIESAQAAAQSPLDHLVLLADLLASWQRNPGTPAPLALLLARLEQVATQIKQQTRPSRSPPDSGGDDAG